MIAETQEKESSMSAVQKQVAIREAPATPMEMLANAIDKGMAPETVDKLMVLAERWDKMNARKAFDVAIAAAKAEIPVIIKNSKGHNDKRYADFAAIARVVDPIISRHGLSYRFRTVQDDKIKVTCVLSHEAGHYEETTLAGPADTSGSKNAIQSIGSTLTYLQRYSLVQALGLAAAEDDDGKAGGSKAISGDEAKAIRDAIEALKDASVEPRLLKWLKVETVEAIPADRYDDAMGNLQKIAKQKAPAA